MPFGSADVVDLRLATASDRATLFALYVSERAAAYSSLRLAAPQLTAVLESQMRARDVDYALRFPAAKQWMVVAGESTVGQLLLEERPAVIRVLEFSILPDRRRCGFGGAAMRWVQAEAVRTRREVTLRVRDGSDAARLYQRLGFVFASAEAGFLQMVWAAAAG